MRKNGLGNEEVALMPLMGWMALMWRKGIINGEKGEKSRSIDGRVAISRRKGGHILMALLLRICLM